MMSHPASYRRILHRMGYYNYQQGLIYRHLNQEFGWSTHLMNCRAFILKSIDLCKPDIITILGTGWLLDVPLKEMAEKADKIYLVDILHPPEVRNQVAGFKNVVLLEIDVTGGLILSVWQKTRNRFFFNKLSSIGDIEIPEFKTDFNPGMIISLNIMTQLESLLLEFLKRRSRVTEDEYLGFRREIQVKHLSLLCKNESVLITDLCEIVTDNSGRKTELPSVLIDLPEARIREEWTWDFDFRMSDYYNKRSVFKVAALLI